MSNIMLILYFRYMDFCVCEKTKIKTGLEKTW